jgi:hypothetical protein
MKHAIVAAAAAALLTFLSGAAQAQGAASAPAPGMGPRSGMGPGDGMQRWRMNRDNTPGWSLMSRDERRAHQQNMRAMTDHAACTAYMQQHHAQMVERAKERRRPTPSMPRRDACATLKK